MKFRFKSNAQSTQRKDPLSKNSATLRVYLNQPRSVDEFLFDFEIETREEFINSRAIAFFFQIVTQRRFVSQFFLSMRLPSANLIRDKRDKYPAT